jgi:hypothetical protein
VHDATFPLEGVYGYAPEDITVLKDDPNFPDLQQPTRANMVGGTLALFLAALTRRI